MRGTEDRPVWVTLRRSPGCIFEEQAPEPKPDDAIPVLGLSRSRRVSIGGRVNGNVRRGVRAALVCVWAAGGAGTHGGGDIAGSPPMRRVRPGPDGRFAILDLVAGDYVLGGESAGGVPLRQARVTVPADPAALPLPWVTLSPDPGRGGGP